MKTLRALPSIDRLLSTPEASELLALFPRKLVTDVLRAVVAEERRRRRAGDDSSVSDEATMLVEAAARELESLTRPGLVRVVNATGVILHTNLGRALLAEEAVAAIVVAARSTVTLEYDPAAGRRGERDELIAADLEALTGAPAGTVVNNNAAALLLALGTLANGREVIVSRGELIEIGGSFRLPEILAASGARLREVGTTNRTSIDDYRSAIGPETALLLKVHTSNYKIVGFTSSARLDELVTLGRAHDLPVLEDLGSGALIDLAALGLPAEPVVRERIAAGADLVTFSGDKLLGGPQAGIIVGRADLIARLRRNPLRRALRPGKLTFAGLAATLRLYRTATDLPQALPTLRVACRSLESIERMARAAHVLVGRALGPGYAVAVVESTCEVGSGALPGALLPSWALAITHPAEGPDTIARRFRAADPPIIGRIHGGSFFLDLRAIDDPTLVVPHAG